MKLVTCLPLVLVLLSVGKGHMVSKRQAEQQNQPAGNSFHLFGQILGGLARLFGTAVEEGGNFLAKQAEVNQPVVETVANISSTIGQSEFVRGVQGSAGSVVRGTSCILMCTLMPEGDLRTDCEERNCQGSSG